MENALLGIPHIDLYLVIGILLTFVFFEILAGYWSKTKRTSSDWIQEMGSYLVLGFVIKPLIVVTVLFIGNEFFSSALAYLSGINFWILLVMYLFIDDFIQYWYHRSAHEYDFLWKLHRPHHQAEEMGFFVSYRNAALYYVMMPNIWWIGLFTFLGGAKAVAVGLILKQLVIIGSHSTLHYDKVFYRYKSNNLIVNFVHERTVLGKVV